ncbi:hypothetical protein BU16DRAFT_520913 [Lophium mytilinum]|uniref:DUF7730 domain-containing protein n=1 Tax=Lophium mytilinum TaxID=390894 RepID=A0A6A6RB48_9PEZI|nr:hypothetical protein BU16DRAFT_520913 [Lophium mytilinum]
MLGNLTSIVCVPFRCGGGITLDQKSGVRRKSPKGVTRRAEASTSFPLPLRPRDPNVVPQITQPESSLFKLPAELRDAIYREVLGGHVLHLNVPKTSQSESLTGVLEAHECRYGAADGDWRCEYDDVAPFEGPASLLSMLFACRQIYYEAMSISMSILYSTNAFSLDLDLLMPSLPQTCITNVLPPESLNAIKSLNLLHRIREPPPYRYLIDHEWASAWRAIASMKGLQHLRVNIMVERYDSFWRRQEVREEWLYIEAEAVRVVEVQMEQKILQSFEIRAPATDIRDAYGLGAYGAVSVSDIEIGGTVYPIWRVAD